MFKGNVDTSNVVDVSKILGLVREEEATTESQPETAEEPKETEAQEESAPSQEGEQPEETKAETSVETKEIPFNKHPRFKRLYSELKELRAWKDEMEQQRQQQNVKTEQDPVKPEMSPEFVKLFGDNPEAWEMFDRMMTTRDARVREQAKAEMQQLMNAEQERARQAEEVTQRIVAAIEDKFLDLAEETGIDMTDPKNTERNQILDICEKYQLFNADGAPNIEKANELRAVIYPDRSREVVEEKRQVVAKTNVKTNSSVKESDVFTPSKLKEIEKRGGAHFFQNS